MPAASDAPGVRPPTPPASPAQALCVECGLCCDGTLYPWAPLSEADTEEALRAAGFTVLPREEGRSFALPCAHHCGACQIYHGWRPEVCGSFRCLLLRRHDAGEVSHEQALKVIRTTTRHAQGVRAALRGAGDDTRGALVEIYAAWEAARRAESPEDWAQRHSGLLLEYAALKRRLGRYFGLREDRDAPSE